MTWIKKFFQPKQKEADEQLYLLCSACMSRVAEEDVRVIPWWNTTLEDFLTTYRCERCWIECLGQTRIKIKTRDADVRENFCEFLQRLEHCQSCHMSVKHTDYVSRRYLPNEVWQKLK